MAIHLALSGFGLGASPAALAAQGLPPYASLNPVVEMRSGLSTLPRLEPGALWHAQVTTDYGSLIEYTAVTQEKFVLDAEIFSTRVSVARAVGGHGFVLAGITWSQAGDGQLDGLFDAYHDLIGVTVTGRDLRPENDFAYRFAVGQHEFEYEKASGFLGDLRVGAGLRHHDDWQSVFSVTLPTGTAPDGYRKGVASANLTTLVHRDFGREARYGYEGTFGVGVTPRRGELQDWQRTTFFLVAQGMRARLLGPLQAYANVVFVTPYYRDTGIPELNLHELTLDLGALVRFAAGPTWLAGMTQDLAPHGPAVDVVFRLGAYW
ncbi:MAG: DUF3187 family protein [Gemmatimonadota bacterium]